ncbi:MAG: hypothetical protein V1742_05305 [Pseudomonadota bacterium]
MPKVQMPGEKTEGLSGTMEVGFMGVEEKLLDPTDWRPASAIAVAFNAKGMQVKLAVPLEKDLAFRALRSIFPDMEKTADETRLRSLLSGFPPVARWASCYNGWVQRWACPPGIHLGKLADVSRKQGIPSFYLSTNPKTGDQTKRVRFVLETAEGLASEFSVPWGLETRMGNTPAEDYVKFTGVVVDILCLLGLNRARLEADLNEASQLYDRPEVMGPLHDPENIFPVLLERLQKDGLKTVQWEVVNDPKYGPGIKREGTYKTPAIKGVVMVEGKQDPFEIERDRFIAIMDKFCTAYYGRETRFVMPSGSLTDDGKAIAKGILKPIVVAYPHIVKNEKGMMNFPISAAGWQVDGLASLGIVMELLMGREDFKDPTCISLTDPAPLMAWVKENAGGTLSFTVGGEAI